MRFQRVLLPFAGEAAPEGALALIRALAGREGSEVQLLALGAREPVAAVLEEARASAPSLIAAPSGLGGPDTLARLVRGAKAPVLVLPAGARPALVRRIVLPALLDARAPDAVLPAVRELAARLDATIVLLGVVASPGATVAARSRAEALLDECHARLRGVPALKRIVAGAAPAAAILDVLEEDDLVALDAAAPWEAVLEGARCALLVAGGAP